jgi:late competence protein required for DNA uptake (superfamily II DNA/RNA helicase)
VREAKQRFQCLRAKSNIVTTGNQQTMLKHYQCFSRILQKVKKLANIERLALVLEVQAIAGNKGECLRCNTIKSERDRVRIEVKIYCPNCGVTHVWHIGIGQLLLIGTGVVRGGDILLLA